MQFSELGLHESLLKNIEKMGFTEATNIQCEVIPLAISGKDVSGLSKTGTGKTAAFLIPSIHRLMSGNSEEILLCIAPTRELAIQIEAEAKKLSEDMNLGTVSVVGGMSSQEQMEALKKGARIVIGTPGRLIDLYKERALDLGRVGVLVFDEADRMFDMGFIKDMRYLLAKIPEKRQILLFSATLNFSVLHLIYEFGSSPTEINVSRDQVTADGIQQAIFQVGDNEKPKALIAMCRKFAKEDGAIIVFSNYKERVQTITAVLNSNGFPAQGLSSLMRQDKRNRIIQGFRTGKFRALVATDVASRGLDIDNVGLVVNYHLPEDAATYVHRIGRTARAGKSGMAVSIASSEDGYNQIRVEEFLGKKIPVEWLGDEDLAFDLVWPDKIESDDDEDEASSEGPGNQRRGRQETRGRRESRPSDRRDGRRDNRRDEPRGTQRRQERPEGERQERPERQDRQARGEKRDQRPAREHGENRDQQRTDHRRGRDQNSHSKRPVFTAPEGMPSPVTGNPIIYCTRTGDAKNRSSEEMAALLARTKPRVAGAEGPQLLKKIRSKVSALFSAKK